VSLVFGFFLLSLSAVAASQTTVELDVVLEEMKATGLRFRSLEADIERTKVVVFVNDRATDFGKVYFSGGGEDSRIRLTITEPAVQELLVANGRAQLYRPRINYLEEYDLGDRRDIAEFLMIGFGASNQTLEEDYEVALVGEEALDGVPTSVLELKPRSERVAGMFPTIRLWIDQTQWIPLQSRVNQTGGDYQIVRYSNIEINERLPNDIFELDLPKDVNR
jgi:outer membrane lipoprotein-sorting protein